MARIHVTVWGRVQGVGFRGFVLRRARALGLAGWVRNRSDGGVETDAEGPREALARLVEDLRQGPSRAEVVDVEVAWDEGPGRNRDFVIGD